MPIKKLPDLVISRIAAGEVITSPYNIIKELIENSLDAKSSLITVNIDSSLKNLSVRDNGIGIEKSDLEFICLNHYTSKIEAIEDLKKFGSILSASSFGFRGEALHSISLCSHIKIQTKSKNSTEETGIMAVYNNDKLIEIKECAFEGHGTLIEIRDIFYNNQIRSEYYLRNKTELINYIALISYYGIIHSSLECKVDGKVVLGRSTVTEILNDDEILENKKRYIINNIINSKGAIGNVKELKSLQKSIDSSGDRFLIICSDSNTSFKSNTFIFFINGRLIKNETIKSKILQKFRAIKKNCNPFVYVEMYLTEIDVNIHPSKSEVLVNKDIVFPEILKGFDQIFKEDVYEVEEKTSNIKNLEFNNDTLEFNDAERESSQIFNQISYKGSQSSPLKIYSSPYTRTLNEKENISKQKYIKYSLISLKNLLSEFKEIDPTFMKSLVFVGSFQNNIFVQHQANLLKIKKSLFLFNIFYQKVLKEFGNFECVELKENIKTKIDENLWELLREYFGVHIENSQIIAMPKIYDIEIETAYINDCSFKTALEELNINKSDEITTIRDIATFIAKIYSNIEIDVKLFNKIKVEAKSTLEIADSMSLMTDLKDLYKTFDRC